MSHVIGPSLPPSQTVTPSWTPPLERDVFYGQPRRSRTLVENANWGRFSGRSKMSSFWICWECQTRWVEFWRNWERGFEDVHRHKHTCTHHTHIYIIWFVPGWCKTSRNPLLLHCNFKIICQVQVEKILSNRWNTFSQISFASRIRGWFE